MTPSDPSPSWHILTGEYPPRPGGVSDYTESIARGLAASGETVHVWTAGDDDDDEGGVAVHRRPGGWRGEALRRLGEALDAVPPPRRLLVQYTPNAWGLRGANLAFGRWLAGRRRRGDDVWAMIHEPYYPWRLREKPSRWALAAVHRAMMYDLFRASSRLFVASETYFARLRPYDPGRSRPMTWSPIPSAIPTRDEVDPAAVAAARGRLAPVGSPLIGHFGTFDDAMKRLLRDLVAELSAGDAGRRVLLVGRGGGQFAAELAAARPDLAGRVTATGGLAPADVAAHLAACDVLVQPYPDGVSTRRSSIMAGLGLGLPIVTNAGPNTEPLWRGSGAVRLAGPGREMAAAVEGLLADPAAREELGRGALDLYERRFAVARTVEQLLGNGEAGAPAGPGAAGLAAR